MTVGIRLQPWHFWRPTRLGPRLGSVGGRAYRVGNGLWQHAPYFHNGAAATLDAAVQMYNTRMALGLSASQMADLVQYLKSL